MSAWRVRLVAHPLTVVALLTLAVNDHVLKQRWPGLVTGKLSDLAGVYLIGALLMAALGTVRWGAALTALGFAALKTSASVAMMAAPLLGGVTRRDPTDLVALLVLWPLGHVAARCGARRPRRVDDAWSTIGAVFVGLSAVLTTSATSCDTAPEVSDVAITPYGRPIAYYEDYGSSEPTGWYLLGDEPTYDALAAPGGAITTEVCVAEGCYSVEPDVAVYLDETLVYAYSPEKAAAIRDRSKCFQEPSFGSLVVVDNSQGEDRPAELWVSAGMAGVLHRDAQGVWHEISVGDATPPAEPGLLGAQQLQGARPVLWVVPLLLALGAGPSLLLMNRAMLAGLRRRLAATAVTINIAWAALSYAWHSPLDVSGQPAVILGFFVMWWAVPLALLQLVWIKPLTRWVRSQRRPPPPPASAAY